MSDWITKILKIKDEKQAFMDAYHKAHSRCPHCNKKITPFSSMSFFFTVMDKGGIDDDYQDNTKVGCRCKWRGTIDDLMPEN